MLDLATTCIIFHITIYGAPSSCCFRLSLRCTVSLCELPHRSCMPQINVIFRPCSLQRVAQIKVLLEASTQMCSKFAVFFQYIFYTPFHWQFPAFLFMLLAVLLCFLLQLKQNFPRFSRVVQIITCISWCYLATSQSNPVMWSIQS